MKLGTTLQYRVNDWAVIESEDGGHFAKLVSPLGTIATIPRWQAIAIARMHNEALKTYSDELDKLSDSETEQWEAYGAKCGRIIRNLIRFGRLEETLLANNDGIEGFSDWAALKATVEDAKALFGLRAIPRKEEE